MTTRQYFSGCVALPIAVCILGVASDPIPALPVLITAAIVYVPLAIVAWLRIRRATHLDHSRQLGVLFPFGSALLLGAVMAFPLIAGWDNADSIVPMVGFVVALIVGYSYVAAIYAAYAVLKKAGLVSNEFALSSNHPVGMQ